MKIYLYSVKDTKAKTFGAPFAQMNDVTATRMFSMQVNRPDPDNLVYNNPGDFELYKLGVFDNETGACSGTEEPHLLITGENLKKEKA